MSQGIRRPRRLLAACERCHFQKIKCSGAQPCQTCAATGRACHYPAKERKVRVPESYLNQLEADSRRLRGRDQINAPVDDSKDEDEPPSLSKDESNLFNPLFDRQPERPPHERSLEPAFIGEASCAAFSNRLLSCLDDICTPLTAGLSNYHRLNTHHGFMIEHSVQFPERMSVKLLLSVARRFIGNYHPLFLEVSFMKEIDAVYQKEIIPSRLWRCKFFALMAVGEIYAHRRGVGDGISVPGINYYEKAVHLMQEDQDYCEEPSLMQVEVLTLLAWVSNIVGRVRTAYCYSGIATRLALSLGMHRAASRYTTLTPVERETRRRTWWVLYFFDRFSASKLGHPIAVRDEDIDVEMPSMEGLTTEEMAEFLDPRSLIINIKLGRIIGNILTQIYGIPKATNGRYIHQVHSILKQLRAWHDELPPDMLVRERDTPRTVANLALAFNQCIIQTTRPVLLHLFKTQVQLGSRVRQDASSIILALADSCVNAAQASSHIVENLFLDGSIAMFGYYDAQHIFSAAMILLMSAVMKPTAGSSEHLETLLGALRCLRENGNIPAVDFCDRLSHIQTRISTLRATGRLGGGTFERPSTRAPPVAGESESAFNHTANQNQLETPSSVNNEAEDHAEILGNPLIGSFLDTNKAEWMDYLFADGTLGEFNTEIEEQFLFGS